MSAVLWLRLDELHPGANARGELGDVDGLAMSIAAVGQIQPLLVEENGAGGYTIYDGHRRYAALVKLRAPKVKVVVQQPVDGVDRAVRQVAMHATAEGFDAIAESDAIHALFWEKNLPQEQIARMVGHSPAWVRDRLALRVLTDTEKRHVRTGRMSLADALATVRQRRAERDGKPAVAWPGPVQTVVRHFGQGHPLATAARAMCRPQKHSGVLAKVACGPCWERAIRTDERSRPGRPG